MTTLPDWLTKRLNLTPDKTAIEFYRANALETLTWQELAVQVHQTVETLRGQGVTQGNHVAILMGNGLPFVLAIHALIQLRAIAVPLNTRLTPSELAWQLKDVGATFLLTDDAQASLAEQASTNAPLPILNLSRFSFLVSPFAPIPLDLSLSDTHSILYTSGTTGNPKGVMLTYGNHWWSAMGSALNLGIREEDKWLLVLPLFHVGGLSMLFKSVIYGNTVQIHERFDVEAVNHALDHDGITHISLVATMLQRLLDARNDTPYPNSLRTVLLGGGPCPQPLLERCARLGIPVVQTYGMTETASQSVTLAPQDALRKLGSAGKALFPTELRIEQAGRPAEVGEIGEILLRGPNVTLGYAGRPDATAQAIREGWLHTGDLGYLDEEGYLFVVNRRTDLIISGGENVYPAEIEAVLLAHPDIAEAVVVGIPDEQWGQVVGAAVVLHNESTVDDATLTTFARERLAKFKVPRHLKIVAELPRNAGGKVVRSEVKRLF